MAQAKPNNTASGCTALLLVGGIVLMIGMCSAQKDKTAQSFASPTLTNQIEAMETPPTPAPIAPLSPASLRTARQHLNMVSKAEGISGAMIYSQNCYDALSRSFSWAQLDVCGGFDMLAVSAAETADVSSLASEAEYFGSEAAAGRYLAVAIKAGQASEDADKRLEALQKSAAAVSVKVAPTPVPVADDTAGEAQEAEAVDNVSG